MKTDYLGIEIGGTKLQLLTGDASGKIREKIRFDIVREDGAIGIQKQIEQAVETLFPADGPFAAGIGFGGPVNRSSGKISKSYHIAGWSNFNIKDWLQSLIDAPVIVENDANAAALGEAIRGAGAAYKQLFYVTLGSGVGGGMVNKRRIYHGTIPGESEIGHVLLDRNGTTIESRCSGWSVDSRIIVAINKEPDSILAREVGDATAGQARFLRSAAEKGDPSAQKILEETGRDLAFGLSHVVHLFHPEAIILGGGLSLIGEQLRKIIEAELPAYVMSAFRPGPTIHLAQLGEDAVIVGALELARQKFPFSNDKFEYE